MRMAIRDTEASSPSRVGGESCQRMGVDGEDKRDWSMEVPNQYMKFYSGEDK